MKALSIAVLVLASAGALADASGVAGGAPAELMHFEKLIGNWVTTEESLTPDGSDWVPSNGADWSFSWAFDGWGVRDDYRSPPISEPVADESKRQRGTNLRIFDPAAGHWVMTWLTVASATPVGFTATSTEQRIVMLSDVANPQGNFGRVTFFDITDSSFEWKLEWSIDKQQWTEVYRIHGKRAVL